VSGKRRVISSSSTPLALVLSGALAAAGLISAGHALLYKRDPRAAWGWILVCLTLPGLGTALYWLMGVNRIRTRARTWKAEGKWGAPVTPVPEIDAGNHSSFPRGDAVSALLQIADRVTRSPLLGGNRVRILYNGEAAYPAMLDAIASARDTVSLSTYIFRTDRTGTQFVDALAAAAERGVDVRVLLDGLGLWYSWPHATRVLRRTNVRVSRFLPLGRGLHLNLRNHRKLLIVDGRVGFTGGLNIGDHHLAEDARNPRRVVDLHVAVEGPVVEQLETTFLQDWCFATGERGNPRRGRPAAPTGPVWCRGISAGPDEDFEKLYWIVLGALSAARTHLRIMTPYFIPDRALVSGLGTAALRGIRVDVVLPRHNNLPYVDWAMRAFLWEVLRYGVRVYFQPAPFVHSKLVLVDDGYALVGSANLDPRSLRLNFEFNLEIYDEATAGQLARHFDEVRARSHEVTLAEMDGRRLPERLRDAAAKLLSPYL
jgi:cardiolipin synthase